MTDERYNGWANYETWNVALWIGNDEGLYNIARSCRGSYREFVKVMKELADGARGRCDIAYQTPDGVAWNDSCLDTDELDDMLEEL